MTQTLFRNRTPYIIFMITLLGVMGVASITPAFPSIINHFGLSKKEVALLITSFSVPGIFLSPITGILADRFGRKKIIVPSLILFGISGTACFWAQNFELLLVLRFFQGLGAASLGSLNITLIGDMYQGNKRAKMMGANASVLSIGTASYPLIGGLLASISWEWVFILPIFGVVAGFIVNSKLNNPEPKHDQHIQTYFSNVWKNINQRSVWGLFVINILLFVILYGALLSYYPSLLFEKYGADSRTIGYTMSLASISTALISFNINFIRNFLSAKARLAVGGLAFASSMVTIAMSSEFTTVLIAMVIFGIGQGVLMPSLQNILVSYASLKERAAFMSINGMVLRIGQSIGPLIISLFYIGNNIKSIFYAGFGFSILLVLLVIFWLKDLKEN